MLRLFPADSSEFLHSTNCHHAPSVNVHTEPCETRYVNDDVLGHDAVRIVMDFAEHSVAGGVGSINSHL